MSARDTILVIETSNPTAGGDSTSAFVAMASADGTLIDSEPLSSIRGGRDDLHPAIERLRARTGRGPDRLASVAVSVGPGGYTGLRVAVSAAALIAECAGIGVVELPTALVAARSVPLDSAPRGIVLASKGDTCHLSVQPDQHTLEDRGVVRADAFEALDLTGVLADAHLPAPVRDRLDALGVRIEPIRFAPEHACALAAELDTIDPVAVRVRYAREPDAVTQWRLRHPPPQ